MYHYILHDDIQQMVALIMFLLFSNDVGVEWRLLVVTIMVWTRLFADSMELCGVSCTCVSAPKPHRHDSALIRLASGVLFCCAYRSPFALLGLYEVYLQCGYSLYEKLDYYDR